MKKLTSLIALLCITLVASSQDLIRSCASAENMQTMLVSDANFANNRSLIESQTQYFITHPALHKRTVKLIPVVVHVIYNLNSQNISVAQIQSQIDALNADFRKTNADISNLPGQFSSDAADCEIQFTLAKRDPNGDTTSGITRTYTTTTSFTANDAMKYAISGGHDAWPRDSYLNIWVCKLSNGLLGYAQFPGGPAASDGVVIKCTAFGTTGTATVPFNKGRSATHEIGHWFNLYHIWGDDGGTCAGDDQVNDTPNQSAEHYGCPSFPQISTCSPNANGDMFMNYMDYTDDACMNMFSNGQKARMDAMFMTGGARESLLNSLGAIPPAQNTGLTCGDAINLNVTNITDATATLNWDAVSNASSYKVQYRIQGVTTWMEFTSSVANYPMTSLVSNSIYEYQIQTVCSFGISSFSPINTFSTLTPPPPPPPACVENNEPNDRMTTPALALTNTSFTSMISTNTDVDYFSFTTTAGSPKVRVTLSNLPLDYDLKLYKANGVLIATSQNASTRTEKIVFNNSAIATTYKLKVYGYNGTYSNTSCYTLNIETAATSFKEEVNDDEITKPEISYYPNPASDVLTAEVFADGSNDIKCSIYNAMGQMVQSKLVTTEAGGNSIPFNVSNLPNGIYLLEMLDGQERKIQKFMVSK